jgi:parvulin-like peptidyl-prolyl isomerase
MARRVVLPRLTHRQRMARWQRERRQMAVVVTVFTALLVFVLGIAAWAASDRYYQANLAPAATVHGISVAKRDFQTQVKLELVRLYQDYGVPVGSENDPQLASAKAQYQDLALERVVEHRILDLAARDANIAPAASQIEDEYQFDYGEYRVRHVLIAPDKEDKDTATADNTARAKARAISDLLKQSPNDQDLWNRVAQASSDDPGTKDAGGELGWTGKGQFVSEFEEAVRTFTVGQVSEPIKTQFGYHIIQLEERRTPEQTDVFKRYTTSGFTSNDLRAQSRYEVIKSEFGKRAQADASVSPTEQVHLARIVISLPTPSSGDYQSFLDALKKQTDVKQKLDSGTDFAEVAKASSDDPDAKTNGGDAGWFARGMIPDPRAEEAVFKTEVGKTTDPISSSRQWTIYKVLEKDPSRALTDEQKTTLKQTSYQYWLARQKKAYDAHKLVPGLSPD